MTKRREIEDPESCLNKAADDEPLFVLRAKDLLAPAVVRTWIAFARLHGCSDAKLAHASELVNAMLKWQVEHGAVAKFPD